MRILVVEDEPRMANVIARGLREQSYAVDVAPDGIGGTLILAYASFGVAVLRKGIIEAKSYALPNPCCGQHGFPKSRAT